MPTWLRVSIRALALFVAVTNVVGVALFDAPTAHAGDDVKTARRVGPAAQGGDARSQTVLGFMYATGRGVPQHFGNAVEWYSRAADQGDPTAQYLLGLMYDKGQGVPQDWVLAHKWLILATANAPRRQRDYYARIRDAVAFKLTPAQIDEAQDLANAWRPVRER
jgi:TPR repeat protein